MILVLIGPMGCGKTTIGKLLSDKLGWRFEDADDFHSETNIQKMKAGVPLNDDDRLPWLKTLGKLMQQALAENQDMILACSALKKQYRQILGIDQKTIHSVYLKASQRLLEERVLARSHEFMNKSLISSQLDTLEEPVTGIVVGVDGSPDDVVRRIEKSLNTIKAQ